MRTNLMTTMEEGRPARVPGPAATNGRLATGNLANSPADLHDTSVEFPKTRCIHELIEEQVRRTPAATAVVFEDSKLTYSELDERATQLAAQLQGLGVGPDVPVGLCLERSLEMMVGLLGILKAGGCYVPLDPAYPKERLAMMLADARPPVLLTQASLRDRLGFENHKVKLLCVDETGTLPPPGTDDVPRNLHLTSAHLAYLIYTSGSTGQPKGVMVTHRNAVNFFSGMDRVLSTEPGVWLAVTSISFDISVLELFWTLARGFTVVIRPEETRTLNVSVPEQILLHGVTHLQCTPSLAGNFILSPEAPQALGRLRKLLVGGEAFPVALAAKLRRILGGELFNMYGPTETTVWSATHRVIETTGGVPIGRPIANTEIHILDDSFNPVATGEAGEIFIGGEGVARGYFNRPELTAEKFVPDPFHPGAGARLYRTGDVGRYRADEEIEFLGRVDNQVKLHGHRIELGEIESVLREHAAVRECVVHIWEPKPGDRRLAAYIVPVGASATLAGELRRFLESKLPSYMIPAAFVSLEGMPLTPNGKIDRKALPQPGELRSKSETAFAAPQNQIEEAIACIWRDVLRVEKVGTHDNFFDLGGTSLLLLEVHGRLRREVSVDLSIVRLFEHPTISALAGFFTDRESASFNDVRERAIRQRQAFGWRQVQAVNV